MITTAERRIFTPVVVTENIAVPPIRLDSGLASLPVINFFREESSGISAACK